MPVAASEFLMMLMPIAAAAAIVLGRQQQRLAALERETGTLRRTALDMEALVEQAPLGLAVLDRELRYVRLNRLLAELNGLAVDDHIGRSIHDVVPDIAPAAAARFRQVMETRRPLRGQVIEGMTDARPDVRRTWRENVHPLQARDGTVLGVAVTVEDITEQQHLAEALRQSQRREQRRVRELESLMRAAPAALLVASDAQCHHVRGNALAERLLRLQPGESPSLSGPDAPTYEVYDAGMRLEAGQLPLQRAAGAGEEIWAKRLTVRFADGDELDVLVNAIPLRDERGDVAGAVAAFSETGGVSMP